MFRQTPFYVLTRLALRNHMRRMGYSREDINHAVDGASNDMIDTAIDHGGVSFAAHAAGPVGAIGDGTILKAIADFLASPAGQALIQILLSLLLKK